MSSTSKDASTNNISDAFASLALGHEPTSDADAEPVPQILSYGVFPGGPQAEIQASINDLVIAFAKPMADTLPSALAPSIARVHAQSRMQMQTIITDLTSSFQPPENYEATRTALNNLFLLQETKAEANAEAHSLLQAKFLTRQIMTILIPVLVTFAAPAVAPEDVDAKPKTLIETSMQVFGRALPRPLGWGLDACHAEAVYRIRFCRAQPGFNIQTDTTEHMVALDLALSRALSNAVASVLADVLTRSMTVLLKSAKAPAKAQQDLSDSISDACDKIASDLTDWMRYLFQKDSSMSLQYAS